MSRIVVLGGAESGVGAAVLAKVKGFDVFLSDNGKIKDEYKALLVNWQIAYEEGGHTEEKVMSADEVVKSPGIPETRFWLVGIVLAVGTLALLKIR